jgi:lipoprotein-anchoring transpeptidase ErfK/SrfK
VGKKDKWVDVRVTWGTLVAYEGDTPVYATAISPGQDGVTQRSHGHNTMRGTYNIGWKLVTADMAGVEKLKEWAVDEVPFVAYYKDSYALHGAWWHDDFGRPKSHGCVNLAPTDAKFLWSWMEPGMPEGWYAVAAFYPEVKGTTVVIRP